MSDPEGEASVPVSKIEEVVRRVLGERRYDDEDAPGRQAGRRAVNTRLELESNAEDKIMAAVSKLRRQDEEDRERREHHDRLKKVEDKVKEKTPVQRSGAHKFMGWGEPAE